MDSKILFVLQLMRFIKDAQSNEIVNEIFRKNDPKRITMRTTLTYIIVLITLAGRVHAQTNSVASGNWSDGITWSTGTVPGSNTDVNVMDPLVLDQNIAIGTGDYLIYQSVTDVPGGGMAILTATTSGGLLEIKAGTTTLEGTASFQSSSLIIRNGATLILGSTTFNNNTTILIEAGGTLVINGTLTNSNSAGSFTLNGIVYVNGNYTTNNGNIDVGGSGDIITTGTIDTQGSSSVFGSGENCGTGPCSGRNLCSGFTNIVTSGNETLCSGGTPTTLTGNAPGPAYEWESSTTSATSGFSAASGTNNQFDYSPAALTQTTWYRRKVTQGGCTGTSAPIQITVLPFGGGWKGTTNDWNLNTNWCNNTVPTSTTDVTISTGVTNMPQMTATSACHDLTIGSGASVTITGSNSFSLYGNLVNNGSLVINTSTVSLVGTTQQSISGSPVTFNNLVINNTTASNPLVSMNGFFNVRNTLTMTSGDIDLNGYNMTLGFSSGSPGTLTYTSGKIIDGEFTRWMAVATIANGSNTGLFPMGTASDSRPFYISCPSVPPNPAGRIKVSHTGATTVTSGLSVTDGASTIQRRQDSYWTVSTSGLTGGTYNLRAGGTGFGTIQNLADLRLMQINSVVGSAGTNGGTISNPQVNRTGLTLANLSTNFYIGSVDPVNSPLPIELLEFTGHAYEGVQLNWTTVSEYNFDYFSVEHSVDGINFKEIFQISGIGALNKRTDYVQVHETPALGKNYYRLKSIDLDGSFENSKPIMILYEGEKQLVVYPNPVAPTHLQYQSNFEMAETDRISIIDQVGMQVASGTLDTEGQVVYFSNPLDPGVYMLQYIGQNFKKVIRIMVK
jgi:hypothetical protein